jgi:hypothetical protein
VFLVAGRTARSWLVWPEVSSTSLARLQQLAWLDLGRQRHAVISTVFPIQPTAQVELRLTTTSDEGECVLGGVLYL